MLCQLEMQALSLAHNRRWPVLLANLRNRALERVPGVDNDITISPDIPSEEHCCSRCTDDPASGCHCLSGTWRCSYGATIYVACYLVHQLGTWRTTRWPCRQGYIKLSAFVGAKFAARLRPDSLHCMNSPDRSDWVRVRGQYKSAPRISPQSATPYLMCPTCTCSAGRQCQLEL